MGARRWEITFLGQGKMSYSLREKYQDIMLYNFPVVLDGGENARESYSEALDVVILYSLHLNSNSYGICPLSSLPSTYQGACFRRMVPPKFKYT